MLDGKKEKASSILMELQKKENGLVRFPIYLTRNISSAKKKIREMAQGKERYGVLISSKAKRLRHYGLFAPQNDFPLEAWFLDGKESIDSSYSMEIAASEFKIQGLEIDYALVGWDGDYKYSKEEGQFICQTFNAKKCEWHPLANDIAKRHLLNSYRVILTRSRQGMVFFIPEGDPLDSSVLPETYDGTFKYLKSIGIPVLE